MTEVSTEPLVPVDATEDPGQAQLRDLLVHYHRSLATIQSLAAALLDASQPGADPLTPEQARANRHAIGEALAAVDRGEALAHDVWRALGIDRRMAPPTTPLPRSIKRDRRRKTRKGSAV